MASVSTQNRINLSNLVEVPKKGYCLYDSILTSVFYFLSFGTLKQQDKAKTILKQIYRNVTMYYAFLQAEESVLNQSTPFAKGAIKYREKINSIAVKEPNIKNITDTFRLIKYGYTDANAFINACLEAFIKGTEGEIFNMLSPVFKFIHATLLLLSTEYRETLQELKVKEIDVLVAAASSQYSDNDQDLLSLSNYADGKYKFTAFQLSFAIDVFVFRLNKIENNLEELSVYTQHTGSIESGHFMPCIQKDLVVKKREAIKGVVSQQNTNNTPPTSPNKGVTDLEKLKNKIKTLKTTEKDLEAELNTALNLNEIIIDKDTIDTLDYNLGIISQNIKTNEKTLETALLQQQKALDKKIKEALDWRLPMDSPVVAQWRNELTEITQQLKNLGIDSSKNTTTKKRDDGKSKTTALSELNGGPNIGRTRGTEEDTYSIKF